jgi:hypothetical protein
MHSINGVGNPKSRTIRRRIAILITVFAVGFMTGLFAHGYLRADTFTSKPAACQPGYIVRAIRGGLPRCVRAPYVPAGV